MLQRGIKWYGMICLPVYGAIRLAKSEEVLYHFQESGNAWRFNFSFMSKKYIRLDLQKPARYVARLTVRFMR